MRFLTEDQADRWLVSAAPGTDPTIRRDDYVRARSIVYEKLISARLLSLAGAVDRWIFDKGEGTRLFWVREHSIWETEHWDLYAAARNTHPDPGHFDRQPAHLAEVGERDSIKSFLFLAMTFGWGWVLIPEGGRRIVKADHDGVLWFAGPEGDACASMIKNYGS